MYDFWCNKIQVLAFQMVTLIEPWWLLLLKWLFQFFSLLVCPVNGLSYHSCKWAVISFLGKNALLLKLELMVLCLIWTMPLSSSPKHALLRKWSGGGKEKGRNTYFSNPKLFQKLPEVCLQVLPRICNFLKKNIEKVTLSTYTSPQRQVTEAERSYLRTQQATHLEAWRVAVMIPFHPS